MTFEVVLILSLYVFQAMPQSQLLVSGEKSKTQFDLSVSGHKHAGDYPCHEMASIL
jgi:hypothetical protein